MRDKVGFRCGCAIVRFNITVEKAVYAASIGFRDWSKPTLPAIFGVIA
jgi:hypothetical protein